MNSANIKITVKTDNKDKNEYNYSEYTNVFIDNVMNK